MKRITALLLALALVLTTGCAKPAATSAAAIPPSSAASATLAPTAAPTPRPTTVPPAVEVRVALIDTGLSSRAIPAERIAEGANYLDPAGNTEDTYGHGTAIASVLLQVAPDAKLVPLISNVYDGRRLQQVDATQLAQMVRDAVDQYDCRIINISAGLVLDKEALRQAIAYAEEQGVLVVASVGNDYAENPGQLYYPAAYDTVLGVGALNAEQSDVAEFSQQNASVALCAPGTDQPILTLSGRSRTGTGTSYAAARVTGMAVRLLEQYPEKTAAELRRLLLDTAQDIAPAGCDEATGWGAADLEAALEAAS